MRTDHRHPEVAAHDLGFTPGESHVSKSMLAIQ
jgi:hypothetical protein